MNTQREQGFTLLELLMVVVIIAVLATIALPQYFRTAERSRSAEALQMLATMRGAEQRYRAGSATNIYTANLTELDVDIANSALWNYGAAGSLGTATRVAGGKTIQTNFDSGKVCTNDTPTYGLPASC